MFNVDQHGGQLNKYVNRVLAQSRIPIMLYITSASQRFAPQSTTTKEEEKGAS